MLRLIRFAAILAILFTFAIRSALPGDRHVILITIDGFPGRMLEDPRAHLPNLRALAAAGASAPKGIKVSTPSVTWPNHTTLVTGVHPVKHSVLFNGMLVRGGPLKVTNAPPATGEQKQIDPLVRKYDPDAQPQYFGPVRIDPNVTAAQLVAVPSLFDVLHAAGLKTAGVNWPCTRSSKSLDDDFPDSPDMVNFTTPRLRAELAAAGILRSEEQKDFAAVGQPQRDEIWTQTAVHLIRRRMPDFMALHLLNTDSTHHKYGPETMASYTALSLADRFVGEIVEALRAAGQREKTTLIVTADHGFATATNLVQPNVLFRQAGLLEVSRANQIVAARVQCVSEGGSGFIYLNNPATREADQKKVVELLEKQEGVAELILADRFREIAIPPARQGGSPDIVLRPKIGYGVGGSAAGTNFVMAITPAISSGYHGYIADEPLMNALFIANGPGIKKGAKIEPFENIDIAPTIAHLLGQKLPTADGKVLREILSGN